MAELRRRLETGEEVVVLPHESAIATEAARRLTAALRGAVEERGEGHIALTGGSSAVALYRELVRQEWRDAVDWSRVHLWWGDERLVPVDHPDSNVGLAYSMLLAMAARAGMSGMGAEGTDVTAGDVVGLPVRAENVHPYEVDEMLSESDPGALVADEYREELERYLPAMGNLPGFDVVLLGVGPDGHILSVFPRSRVLRSEELVLSVPAPDHVEPHHPRVTVNPRLLRAAGLVLVMAAGGGKAKVLADVLGDTNDPARWPAQLARLPNAEWLIDEASAGRLPWWKEAQP